MDEILSFVWRILAASAPLVLLAQGALVSDLAGCLNIGLEGSTLAACFASVAGAMLFPGNVILGLCVGMIAGLFAAAASAALMAYLHLHRGGNVYVLGLGINLLSAGLVPFLAQRYMGGQGIVRLPAPLQSADLAGLVGAVIVTLALFQFLRVSLEGLRLRVLGSDTEMLHSQGIHPRPRKFAAIVFSGLCAGIAGSVLALSLGAYIPNQSAGNGWVALVLLYVGNRKPLGVALSVVAYETLVSLSYRLQGLSAEPGVFIAVPSFLALAALVVVQLLRTRKITQ